MVTEPRRFDCEEQDRLDDRLTAAIDAMTRLRSRLERMDLFLTRRLRETFGTERLRERVRRVRAARRRTEPSFGLVMGLSGDLEVRLHRTRC